MLGLDARRDGIEARRRTGYLPGDLRLFDRLTAREQLDSLSRLRGGVDAQLRDALCERFGVVLDRPIRQLSKGNRQKIGLVQAFMHRPDLVILDEPSSGLDPLLQAELRSLLRETAADGRTVFLSSHSLDVVQPRPTRSLILTTFGRPGYLRRALEEGPSGFLLKDAQASELAAAIREVAAGGRALDPSLAAAAITEGTSPLTAREHDVLAAAAGNDTTADIASTLHLSEGTVRHYLSAAIRKLARATVSRRCGSPKRRAGFRRASR